MTDKHVLEAIQKERAKLVVMPSTGAKITVRLQTNHPPVRLSFEGGDWLLTSWRADVCEGVGLFEYRYQSKEYYIIVKAPEAPWSEVAGTRSFDQEKVCKVADTLNNAIPGQQKSWPFKVRQVTINSESEK